MPKDDKDPQKPARGGGRGGGRGKGRGRGRGRKQAPTEPVDEMEVDGIGGVNGKRSPERTPEKTPEKVTNTGGEDSSGSPRKNLESQFENAVIQSPAVKQEKKRPKRATKAAAKPKAASKPKQTQEEKEDEKMEEKEDEKKTNKQEKKRDSKKEEPEKDQKKDEKHEERETKPRTISDAQVTKAKHELEMYKEDPAGWAHVIKLFDATKIPERDSTPKYMYWAYSMYWGTRRVGLLQKQPSGKNVHYSSFGGGHCTHIGIPTEACKMLVGALIGILLVLFFVGEMLFCRNAQRM